MRYEILESNEFGGREPVTVFERATDEEAVEVLNKVLNSRPARPFGTQRILQEVGPHLLLHFRTVTLRGFDP